jgi:hypothetical protein
VWEEIDAHRAFGTLPERDPSFLMDRFPCGWSTGCCGHYARCWGEAHPTQALVRLGAPKGSEVQEQDDNAADAA